MLKELQVHKVQPVLKAQQDHKALQVPKVQPVHKVQQELKEL